MQLERGGRIKPKPALSIGDQSGQLTVVAYLGYGHIRPDTGRHLNKPTHWYEVECTCGNHEVTSQSMLNSKRKKLRCVECAKDLQYKHKPKPVKPEDPDVPDFATMRW